MSTKRRWAALFLAICMSVGLTPARQTPSGQEEVPWITFKGGQMGGIASARQVVIRDGATWQAYWWELTGEASAPQDVDFTREQLVALNLGQRPTGGYEVYVEAIRATGPASFTVYFVESRPSAWAVTIQVLTSPWVVVRMPRWTAAASFSKRVVQERTGGDRGAPCGCCWRCRTGERPLVSGRRWSGFAGFEGDPFDPLNQIAWRTYKTGSDSKIEGFETLVIENEGLWQRYWARHTGGPPQAAPKNVDWLKQRVVAVHLGATEAGATVAIEAIRRKRSSEIEVIFSVSKGPSGSRAGSGTPYAIALVDRVAGTFTFERRDLALSPSGVGKCGCGCAACRFRG